MLFQKIGEKVQLPITNWSLILISQRRMIFFLIKQSLSRPLIDITQEAFSCLTSITRLEMSKDLNTAYVYLSFFGNKEDHEIIKKLEEKKGHLRKYIATHTKLKYNPQLIFLLDPSIAHKKQNN